MKKDYLQLLTKDCAVMGNDIFYIAAECNLVFKQNLYSHEIDIIGSVPEELYVEKDILGSVCVFKDELYIAPNKLEKIWIYNFNIKTWTSIERKDMAHSGLGGMLQAFEYNGLIYLIGAHYPAIIVINPETKETNYIEKPFAVKGNPKNISDIYFRAQHIIHDNYLFLPSCIDNTILKMNLKNTEYEWISVGGNENRYSGITYDGNNYWLSPRYNSNIVRWDGTKNVEEIMLPSDFRPNVCYFCGILNQENGILVCNMYSNKTLYIDKRTLQIMPSDVQYSLIKEFQGMTITQNVNGIVNVFKGKKRIFESTLEIERKELYRYLGNGKGAFWCREGILYENQICSLDGYLDYVVGEM